MTLRILTGPFAAWLLGVTAVLCVAPASVAGDRSHSAFTDLLQTYVAADGRVDYSAWKRSDTDIQKLAGYLGNLSRVNANALPQPAAIAHYLNLAVCLLARTPAIENVALPLLYSTNGTDRYRPQKLLDEIGLGDRLRHTPNELSGGQQQRVAIARPARHPDARRKLFPYESFKKLNRPVCPFHFMGGELHLFCVGLDSEYLLTRIGISGEFGYEYRQLRLNIEGNVLP